VHSGKSKISCSINKLGKNSKFIGGLRVIDQKTIDIVKMIQ